MMNKNSAHAREMRQRARGAKRCGVCKGSRYSRPDTVCGRCLGRGIIVPREASTGSWFEAEPPRGIREAVAEKQRKGRPEGSGRVRRSLDW